jgi:uncharacterized membrane protein
MKKIFLGTLFALILLLPSISLARDPVLVTDWYIKDFQSQIVVNKDASLDITETITADCGLLPDKHGIFRTLPLYYQKTSLKKVSTPINLISITDENGKDYRYTTETNSIDKTISWKIGDADVPVKGTHIYRIKYNVKNAIRFDNKNFDELYWNLNGNFWQIETDKFAADITFPETTDTDTILTKEINVYEGRFGQKGQVLSTLTWKSPIDLEIASARTLLAGEGITISIPLKKGFISETSGSLIDKYELAIAISIFLLFGFIIYYLWSRFGKDPKLGKAEMVQYDIPAKLTPLELGYIYKNGYFDNKNISATIIDFAVRKYLTIEELPKKGLLGKKDYLLTKLKEADTNLSASEKNILEALFMKEKQTRISEIRNVFYLQLEGIKTAVKNEMITRNYFKKSGFAWQIGLIVASCLIVGLGILIDTNTFLNTISGAFVVSGIITFIVSFLMRSRTLEGAEVFWQIKGFHLYMKTAEKYREQFNEKENIFEKFLPYAMVFGIVPLWVEKMKMLYGADYITNYHPYWYTGYALASFDVSSFTKSISDLSSQMSEAISSSPSSSGSGGGGFSGGGGGGGGGGGW